MTMLQVAFRQKVTKMNEDFTHIGFVNLNYRLRGRLAACPEMRDEIAKTNNGVWDNG